MKEHEFTLLWKQYEPMLQALVELLHPFAEIAVHDLEKGKIVAIYHNISQRKVGNPSPLKELNIEVKNFPDFFTPYYKQNWDGRALKCSSITLRNKKGAAIGLICINMDISVLQNNHQLLESFLKTKAGEGNPVEIFGSSCEKQAEELIQQHLSEKHLSLSHLNRDQKKELIQHLYRKGLFNFKNAAPFLAKKLNTSRATIYNYIKQAGLDK
jgi:predicted transcriptional regulator YheO